MLYSETTNEQKALKFGLETTLVLRN